MWIEDNPATHFLRVKYFFSISDSRMSLAPCPPASPRPVSPSTYHSRNYSDKSEALCPSYHNRILEQTEGLHASYHNRFLEQTDTLSPSYHNRFLEQIDDRRRQSSVSTSLASPGYSCALVSFLKKQIFKFFFSILRHPQVKIYVTSFSNILYCINCE